MPQKIPLVCKTYSSSPYRTVTDDDKVLLKELGFDLDKKETICQCDYLEVPNHLQCVEEYSDFDNRTFTVYQNNIPIITINQKIGGFSSIKFYISEENIDVAQDEKASSQQQLLTPFQHEVKNCLEQLQASIRFSQAGYGSMIGAQLETLKSYMEENPEECRRVIASKNEYLQLYAQFPKWQDQHCRQSYYESLDVGIGLAVAGHARETRLASFPASKKLQEELKLSASKDHMDPALRQLKKLCYEYANEIYSSRIGWELINEKIAVLKELRQVLDKVESVKKDKKDIEAVFTRVGDTLKKDNDYSAIRFLKQFARILAAAFTFSYKSSKRVSMNEYGIAQFWKPASELRVAKFIKQIRENTAEAKISSPKV